MNKKGYIFTISTFFLLSSLVMLALFFASQVERSDITGVKISSLYDDIRTDVVALTNLSADVSNRNNITTVILDDSLPSVAAGYLDNYKRYIGANYTGHVGSNIENRRGSLAGADMQLNITHFLLEIKPHGYFYEYNNLSKNRLYLYPGNNSSQLLRSSMNLTLGSQLLNVTEDLTNGDLPVDIFTYFEGQPYYNNSLHISRNQSSSIILQTAKGNITLAFGQINMTGSLINDSLSVRMDDHSSARVITELRFNQTSPLIADSSFSVRIKDISWDTQFTRKIWFIKE